MNTTPTSLQDSPSFHDVRPLVNRIQSRLNEAIIGQQHLRNVLVTTLIAGGHVLIESVPGLAKTTAAQVLASSVEGSFKRIQCTPDLMPSDLVGTQVFDLRTQQFNTHTGPIHANIVLLDEINRANAKTQSAMLEAMAEGATTIGLERIELPKPFMVIATQNPIEEDGTFLLPEAQMDRFMVKTILDYPSSQEECQMLNLIVERKQDYADTHQLDAAPASLRDIAMLQRLAKQIHVSSAICQYAVDLVTTSRNRSTYTVKNLPSLLRLGCSPRASISLIRMAQAHALLSGRDYVIPEDIRAYIHDILRHRMVLTFDAIADGIKPDSIIDAIVNVVPVP